MHAAHRCAGIHRWPTFALVSTFVPCVQHRLSDQFFQPKDARFADSNEGFHKQARMPNISSQMWSLMLKNETSTHVCTQKHTPKDVLQLPLPADAFQKPYTTGAFATQKIMRGRRKAACRRRKQQLKNYNWRARRYNLLFCSAHRTVKKARPTCSNFTWWKPKASFPWDLDLKLVEGRTWH